MAIKSCLERKTRLKIDRGSELTGRIYQTKEGVTLFIFSSTQGFPSEYPKLVSERPEQRLRKLLLKRQAFFVMSSVLSCKKYSPRAHSSFFSCSVSLYPERQRRRHIQTNGINHWKKDPGEGEWNLLLIYFYIRKCAHFAGRIPDVGHTVHTSAGQICWMPCPENLDESPILQTNTKIKVNTG